MYSAVVLFVLASLVLYLAATYMPGEPTAHAVGHPGLAAPQQDMATHASNASSPVAAVKSMPASDPPFNNGTEFNYGAVTEGARSLATVAMAQVQAQRAREPIDFECSPEAVPCPDTVVWQNTFPGCGSFHIPLEGKDYAKDNRIWQADLNPLIQERAALMAKEWNPYEHMQARQAYMQFIATNFSSKSDKYMKPISDLEDVDPRCLNEVEPVAPA